jgi:hypothetical protein
MGMAFCLRKRSRSFIKQTVRRMLDACQIDDPLLRLTEQPENGQLDGYSETTNISPLFSCCGAIGAVPADDAQQKQQLQMRRLNADMLSEVANDSGWTPVRPVADFQTEILLLKPRHRPSRSSAVSVRATFQKHGVILSAYDDGLIRLSMPQRPFTDDAVAHIRESLLHILPLRSPHFSSRLLTAMPRNVG